MEAVFNQKDAGLRQMSETEKFGTETGKLPCDMGPIGSNGGFLAKPNPSASPNRASWAAQTARLPSREMVSPFSVTTLAEKRKHDVVDPPVCPVYPLVI
jgi:hypothetical protein